MDGEYLAAALSLLGLRRAGSSSLGRLLEASPDPIRALQLPRARLESMGLHPETIIAHAALRGRSTPEAQRQRDWLLANDIRLITRTSSIYPALLGEIARPPPFLFLQGNEQAVHRPQVAMVGSRKPTPAGREFAAELAAGLARYGLGITSGLARGIDTAAHWGALAQGGSAVAVMGTGPDRIYPVSNRDLASRLLESGGALLTEYPPGTPPDAGHFPQRNRIISGLSLGVVVVEAALPSGSLLTATHAAEQGREVMAVPGPVRSPTSRGCHELLRNGAALVESPEDVIRALGDRFKPEPMPVPPLAPAAVPDPGPQLQRVFDATSVMPCSVDVLVMRTGLGVPEVSAAIVQLELAGLIENTAAGVARLR
jgi:DNA processing protein